MDKFVFNVKQALSDFESFAHQEITDYPSCCGADCLIEFPQDLLDLYIRALKQIWGQQYEEYKDTKYLKSKKPNDKYFKDLILNKAREDLSDFHPNSGTIYLVILCEIQKWLIPILKERNFRVVSDRTVNHNTNNRLYVLLLDPVTPKPKPLKKRTFK